MPTEAAGAKEKSRPGGGSDVKTPEFSDDRKAGASTPEDGLPDSGVTRATPSDVREFIRGGVRPLRVLVAEDDPLVAYHIRGLVQRIGQEVVGTAATADEVMSMAAQTRPDVVLMDIWLEGGSSGIEATRHLVTEHDLPVLLVSGTSSGDIVDDAIASGALGFISKPVTAAELQVNLRIVRHRQDLLNRLRESEERFRSIFDNAAVGIYVCTLEGRLVTVNDTYARMLGYSGQADMLRLVRDFEGQVYDEPGRRRQLCERLQAGETVEGEESLIYGRDGEALWVSEHCRLVRREDGVATRYEGIVVDITARKDAEQRERTTMELLRSTMDALPDLVVLQDFERNVIMVNRVCASSGMVSPGDAMCELPGGMADETPFESFRRDGGEHEGLVRLPGVDGLWWSRVAPFRSPEGEVVGAVEILRVHDGEADA